MKESRGVAIDKAVYLTFKTVGKQWQAGLSKSSANKEFCNELEKLFKTAKEQWYTTITFFCKLNLFFFLLEKVFILKTLLTSIMHT